MIDSNCEFKGCTNRGVDYCMECSVLFCEKHGRERSCKDIPLCQDHVDDEDAQ